jgi:hypothetical protein
MNALFLAPWIAAAAGVIGGGGYGLYQHSLYAEEVAARAQDRANAEKTAREAVDQARDKADVIIRGQAQALAETAARVSSATQRIIQVPVTTACAQQPAIAASSVSVRDIIGSPGGGQATAGRSAPAAVPRSGAGR